MALEILFRYKPFFGRYPEGQGRSRPTDERPGRGGMERPLLVTEWLWFLGRDRLDQSSLPHGPKGE